ncbi:MAG: murein biosynthesis integral membrane protein MurJ [Parcubacteria group bacterium]|nr:murein biosynthesis integral membrane protein MurJ [Parcubacteria group bacterium]
MPQRILNHISTSITGAAVLMAGATFLSRILGLIRDRIFAHQFGAGEILDAYYAAFKIPDLLFNLIILGALSAGFIPVFTKFRKTHGLKTSWPIVQTVLSLGSIVMATAAVFLFIFADPLMSIVAPGFSEAAHAQAVAFTRVMFLSPFFLGFSAVLGGALQSLRQFFVFALAPILYNGGIIVGATLFYSKMGIIGLAWGVVLGALLHAGIQYYALKGQGFTLQFSLKLTHEVKRILYLMAPRTLGLAVSQVSLIALTAITSTLSAGSISAFQLAHNIAFVPIGIFAVSYAVAAFPTLSEGAMEKTQETFTKSFSSTVRQVLFLMIPSTVLFVLLRAQIVRVLLGTGAFDWQDTVMTFDTLAMFAVGFAALGLVHLLVRGFYAFEDTKTPVVIAILAETIVLFVAYLASRVIGVQGIALGVSVGALVQVALLWAMLVPKTKALDGRRILISLFKMTVAALAMAVVMQVLKSPISSLVDMTTGLGIFIQACAVGLAGCITYVAVGLLLKSHEMHVFVRVVREKLIKIKILPHDITDAGGL